MVFVALICIPVFYVDDKVSRGEGMLFLSYYVLYTAYLILESSKSSILPVITLFVSFYIPLTFIGLIMFVIRARRLKKAKKLNPTA
jgi:cation:H+ antiporter